jgi:methionyl-tRNA formyltransferase
VRRGVPLILELVGKAAEDPRAIPRHPQDSTRRKYFAAGPPADGRIDWAQPAEAILRFVRACDYGPYPSPWGVPKAELGGRTVGIARATGTDSGAKEPPGSVVEVDSSGAVVATGDQRILVQRLSLDGRSVKPVEVLED